MNWQASILSAAAGLTGFSSAQNESLHFLGFQSVLLGGAISCFAYRAPQVKVVLLPDLHMLLRGPWSGLWASYVSRAMGSPCV